MLSRIQKCITQKELILFIFIQYVWINTRKLKNMMIFL